ncbi:MAG: hypothetical protein WC364_14025 [Eubacteriales bacterium]|jgi:hypothetical protein
MKKFLQVLVLSMMCAFSAVADVSEPHIYNVTLTSANTEYSLALPAYSCNVTIQCRTAYDVRVAEVTGKVAGSTAPYWTIKASGGYFDNNLKTNKTLYFASAQAGVVVEVIIWGLD